MLSGAIVDLFLGLALLFASFSLLVSGATEGVASILGLRSKGLLAGVKKLLNDPELNGLALQIYNHAAANPLAEGNATSKADLKVKPAYMDPRGFADALISSVEKAQAGAVDLRAKLEAIKDPQIKETLLGLYTRAGNDAAKFQDEVASWFDSAMDRVAGRYKRNTQAISVAIALLLAGALNVDALRAAQVFWAHTDVVASIDLSKLPAEFDATTMQAFVKGVDATLPIGWAGRYPDWEQSGSRAFWLDIGTMLLGWLIAAIATLFGAPFWFDLLQKITRLRSTGPKPAEQPKPLS